MPMQVTLPNPLLEREAAHPVNPLFVRRWSPRAFTPGPMPHEDLLSMLEAARWAPSAFNIQPWRFLYAHRDDENWETFVGLLDPFNASWAQNASALVFVISDTIMPGSGDRPDLPAQYNSFDTGAAALQLALQATAMDYVVHTMAGINFEKTRDELGIPERFRIEVAMAIGKQAEPAMLPETLAEREVPSSRYPVEEISFAGAFQQAVPA